MTKIDPKKERNLFRRRIGAGQRLMGLDMGSKQIGVALSDVALTIASPMTVITRRKFTQTAKEILGLMEKQNVGGLVIGLPLEMSGKEGPAAQSAREFARNLEKLEPGIPTLFMDERLSTSAVERTLIEADTSRARRAEVVDKMAASYFLQAALDLLYEDKMSELDAIDD